MHEHNASTKKTVLLLAQALRAADLESAALLRSTHQLLRAAEYPRRTLWLANRNLHTRQARPIQDQDGADRLLRQEHALAVAAEAQLATLLGHANEKLRKMQQVRKDMKHELETMKRRLGLDPDAYSGTVTTFPGLTPETPACVHAMHPLHAEAVTMRQGITQLVNHVVSELNASREHVNQALRDSIAASRSLERELNVSRGKVRLSQHQATRRAHKLEIQRELNEGPVDGRFLTTAERLDRPNVGLC